MKTKLIAVAAILVVLITLGFRVVHPARGLQSAMGSAKSSIVIYKHSSSYAVGHKVVVEVAGQGKQTGIVKSASDGSVDVDTLSAFVRVKNEDVVGKLVVVVPFFGTILNIVGL